MAYLSPGVYVHEVPSAVRPIAGVGTSTAGFIGFFSEDSLAVPDQAVTGELVRRGDGSTAAFELARFPVSTADGTFKVLVDSREVAATLSNDDVGGTAHVALVEAPAEGAVVTVDYVTMTTVTPLAAGEVKLVTNFAEFRRWFGDFSTNPGQANLAHAAYGFFDNGGTRLYVTRVTGEPELAGALEMFAAIDEIALVAAPGQSSSTVCEAIEGHCRAMGERFAIFDSPETMETGGLLDTTLLDPTTAGHVLPRRSDYAAYYFPWIQVFDPATKLLDPRGDGLVHVPPSGHVAGIYARVDNSRGVHKAPANETVRGAVGLKYAISKAKQDGLNPQGVNCIRDINGSVRVWGARTLGGDANNEWKYINVRRLFLFLRESIDEGTQWVVFEPNTQELWSKITRNVTAFLTNVWRSGALFGDNAAEAFYVKCDAELNTPTERDAGEVITEIGVSVVKPAEFVIFRISQVAGPGS